MVEAAGTAPASSRFVSSDRITVIGYCGPGSHPVTVSVEGPTTITCPRVSGGRLPHVLPTPRERRLRIAP